MQKNLEVDRDMKHVGFPITGKQSVVLLSCAAAVICLSLVVLQWRETASPPKQQLARGNYRHCSGRHDSKVALLTAASFPKEHSGRQVHYMYWLSLINKKAYAAAHGYPLYIASGRLAPERTPHWDKLVAVKAALQHSGAEWLWYSDSDAFVMNQSITITSRIELAVAANPNTSVVLSKDCNTINTGSVLFRNTPWLQQHLADIWAANDSAKYPAVAAFWENGAFKHLYENRPDVRAHYHILPQRAMNAYPDFGECKDAWGYFVAGDFMVHFPGYIKGRLTGDRLLAWLNTVPIITQSSQNPTTSSLSTVDSVSVSASSQQPLPRLMRAGASGSGCENTSSTLLYSITATGEQADKEAAASSVPSPTEKRHPPLQQQAEQAGSVPAPTVMPEPLSTHCRKGFLRQQFDVVSSTSVGSLLSRLASAVSLPERSPQFISVSMACTVQAANQSVHCTGDTFHTSIQPRTESVINPGWPLLEPEFVKHLFSSFGQRFD